MDLSCLAVAEAALGPGEKRGDKIVFTSPRRGDRHREIHVNPQKSSWACYACLKFGTGAWDLAAHLACCDPKDEGAVHKWLAGHGLLETTRPQLQTDPHLTAKQEHQTANPEALPMNTNPPAMGRLQQLPGFKALGRNQWEALCPGHEDRKASLSISTGDDGRILLHCHAGCKPEHILDVVGLQKANLFNGSGPHELHERNILATYDYRATDGTLSYQVVRYQPKDFRQRRPDGNGGFTWNTKGLKRLLYNLPELIKAEYVFVVEGEKDADNLAKIGLTATCNSGGANKWSGELNQYFRKNHQVTIIPDSDEPGRKHAQQVAQSLHGKVASLKILILPGPGKDVSDWLTGRDPEAAAEELCKLSDAVPEWKPPAEPQQQTAFQPPAHWQILDVAHLKQWNCPELAWHVVELFQAAALIIVAAMTQTGKTLLLLYVARKMVEGGLLFGKYKINPVVKLGYFALEDPPRRFRDRLLDHGATTIEPGRFLVYIAPGFKLNDDLCFGWLEEVIRKEGFQVVVLDTYQKATPGISSFNDEQQSVIMHRLVDLVRKLNVTLIVLDHVRKADNARRRKEISIDDIKGTGGKAQNADSVILLERDGARLKFQSLNKDLDHPVGFLLDIAPEGSAGDKFSYAGNLEQLGATSHEKAEQTAADILKNIEQGTWVSCGDLAKRTSFSSSTVRSHLEKLIHAGKVEEKGEKRWKRYRRIDEPTESAISGDITNTAESKVSIASNILPFKEITPEGRAEAALTEPLPT